jgi:hypothetical protein
MSLTYEQRVRALRNGQQLQNRPKGEESWHDFNPTSPIEAVSFFNDETPIEWRIEPPTLDREAEEWAYSHYIEFGGALATQSTLEKAFKAGYTFAKKEKQD